MGLFLHSGKVQTVGIQPRGKRPDWWKCVRQMAGLTVRVIKPSIGPMTSLTTAVLRRQPEKLLNDRYNITRHNANLDITFPNNSPAKSIWARFKIVLTEGRGGVYKNF